MPIPLRALSTAALIVALAPAARADEPPSRDGFWLGFGLGYGAAATTCDRRACEGEREGSLTASLRLGGTLNPRVLAGVESNLWVKDLDGTNTVLAGLAATATFYPWESSGLFVKVGLGLSYASRDTRTGTRLNMPVDATINFQQVGAGVLAGLGYDLRVAPNVSITPSFTWTFGATGTVTVDEIAVPGTRHDVLDFGLGVTFH
jgi:hypothetical protein